MALEECDDGNSANGDGCSNECKIEAGFTCSVPPASQTSSGGSRCISVSSHEIKETLKKMHSRSWDCARQGEIFVAHNAESDNVGSCVAKTAKSAHPQVQVESSTQVSSLAGYSTRTIGRAATRLTCPAPLESVEGGAPYAVCQENMYEVCRTESALNRVCNFRKTLTCEEVCVAPRFCKSSQLDVRGELVYRQHGATHTPTGRACCFKDCVVPENWTMHGMTITPEKWCLPFAHEV